jgi:hypothetical protein
VLNLLFALGELDDSGSHVSLPIGCRAIP